MMEGTPIKRVQVRVSEGDFQYGFDE
jgi:hypothetical protein